MYACVLRCVGQVTAQELWHHLGSENTELHHCKYFALSDVCVLHCIGQVTAQELWHHLGSENTELHHCKYFALSDVCVLHCMGQVTAQELWHHLGSENTELHHSTAELFYTFCYTSTLLCLMYVFCAVLDRSQLRSCGATWVKRTQNCITAQQSCSTPYIRSHPGRGSVRTP